MILLMGALSHGNTTETDNIVWSQWMAELTLEDIAKQVGVSRSTISRVVNGSPNVSPDVRERVLKTIQATGYRPNAAARSLASQRTRIIGLVLPRSVTSFFTDPYFHYLIQGIAFGCNNNDLTLSLFLAGNTEDEEKIFPHISRRGMLDGVLVQTGQPDDSLIEQLPKSNLPTVILGRPFKPEGVNYIEVNNVNAAATATCHLISLGYQRIATITGTPGSAVTMDRLEGYCQAMSSAGREIDKTLIVAGDFSENSGYEAMLDLLPQQPDAVFAASDIMAIGAMRAVLEAGLRIPEDMAFVGFDDLPVAVSTKIKLTTIRQPIMKFGIKAVEQLMDVIADSSQCPRQIIMDTELIIRDSCGARQLGACQ